MRCQRSSHIVNSLLSSITDAYRLAGIYTGRVSQGREAGVQQATKVELIINLKTAKALGVTVPLSLIAAPTRSSNKAGMSAIGTKRTTQPQLHLSAFGPKR